MSVSTENFIKTVYKQTQKTKANTRPSTLAKLLNTSYPATTDMAKKLSAKNLVNYQKYKQITLTSEGKKLALNVLRKHRLWETFLHETLGLSLHEIHREAENLEHLTSDFLTEKISHYLGKPDIDPHGDPIPKPDGKISYSHKNIPLSQTKTGKHYIISRLFGSERDFFDFCHSNHILLGTKIKVEKQYETQHITEIIIHDKRILLNQDFSNIIYVKQIAS